MSGQTHRRRGASSAVLVAAALLLCAPAAGQARRDGQAEGAGGRPAADAARWFYMLDELARDARAIPEAEKRPALVAEVADAYWELDRARARELFGSALEAALSLKAGSKEAGRALRQVIGLAARRDAGLARALTEKVLESAAEKDWAAGESMSVAVEMLDADPQRAAQLAAAHATAGPSFDAAWFILQLAGRDPAAAEQVYRAYLSRLPPGLGLERLLWLAGYPFGHTEAYGGASDPAQMAGFNVLPSPHVSPKPALARAFLEAASRAVQNTLRQAAAAAPPQAEALNALALYATLYLLPEVQRYSPLAAEEWSLLQRQALSGTSEARRDGVARRVQELFAARARTGRQGQADAPAGAYAEGQAEDALARAEKLPAGCRRDVEYVTAALSVGWAKDFRRALEVAGRVENDAIRESLLQFLYYDMSGAAVSRGDAGGLAEAQKHAEQVSAPEQRALLYVKIARATLLRHEDRQSAAGLLRKTMRLAETVSEPSSQATILLASAAGFADFDSYEGQQALKEAVKVVNRARSQDVENFHVLRKVSLACRAGEDTWYGGSEGAERFSLFETFAALAVADADGMLSLARDLDDPSLRLRSQIFIARAMTGKAHSHAPVP